MRAKLTLLLCLLTAASCSKEGTDPGRGIDFEYGKNLSHERIVLGERLENPYKTENITRALASLYPTKADRVPVESTDLYVRFLPADQSECDLLEGMGLNLIDHPLDYDIAVEGDWYHDPQVPEDKITWQYAVVPVGFDFPEVEYEIIDECYIVDSSSATKGDGIDWEAVERQAYIMTGNADRLSEPQSKAASKTIPSGRITIVDEYAHGGKPTGVAGVRVSCNSFVKFDRSYTDRDGYYTMKKAFSSNLRYRLVFQNEKGFAIGMNLILSPASVSTLGKSGPEGINMTVTKRSENKLFRRCVVNNAAYDYYSRCTETSSGGIQLPPSDLRIWIFNSLRASSAVMLHHGALLSQNQISGFLGKFAFLVKFFLPDITIGTEGREDYRSIYSSVIHELSHASHYSKVGNTYWNEYIWYIVESYIRTGGMTYGDGSLDRAGYCEVGEMWAYFVESLVYHERYGGSFPTFGTSFWFYPQIFRNLYDRGFSLEMLYKVLDVTVTSRSSLKDALIKAYPTRRAVIEQVFNRY